MAGKTPAWTVTIALVSVLAVSFALFTDWENRRLATVQNWLGVGQKVSHVIAAFDSLNLRPAAHSTAPQTERTAFPKQMASSAHRLFGLE